MQDQIDILLATYQSGAYLQEQLHSLLHQTHPSIHILIRDDGSTDQTLATIQSFIEINPRYFSFFPSHERLGVKGNFSALMQQSQAPYIMFCDQDDYWLSHKVEISLKCMKELEKEYGTQVPLLVHTDLQVVNSELSVIDPSFWHYARLDPSLSSLNRLLVQNVVTGCTVLINRALLQLAYPIPDQAVMHDWWLALVVTLFGKMRAVPEATLLYRQHLSNHLGAQKCKKWQWITSHIKRKDSAETLQKYQQAQVLLKRYEACLSRSQREILQAFCSLEHLSYLRKLQRSVAYQFFPRFRRMKCSN